MTNIPQKPEGPSGGQIAMSAIGVALGILGVVAACVTGGSSLTITFAVIGAMGALGSASTTAAAAAGATIPISMTATFMAMGIVGGAGALGSGINDAVIAADLAKAASEAGQTATEAGQVADASLKTAETVDKTLKVGATTEVATKVTAPAKEGVDILAKAAPPASAPPPPVEALASAPSEAASGVTGHQILGLSNQGLKVAGDSVGLVVAVKQHEVEEDAALQEKLANIGNGSGGTYSTYVV